MSCKLRDQLHMETGLAEVFTPRQRLLPQLFGQKQNIEKIQRLTSRNYGKEINGFMG